MTCDRAVTASTFSGAVRAALLVGMLLATAGCGERYLHNAQDSFSKGAAIENQAAYDPRSAIPPTDGAVIYYVDARESVRKALTKEKGALDQQGLTGSAYALLAIVSWRLDDLQGSETGGSDPCETRNYQGCAQESRRAASGLLDKQPFLTRDRFMMAILPGLLDHNLGLKKTAKTPKDAGGDFASAFQNIGRGLATIEPVTSITGKPLTTEQSLKIYGLLAQYQTLRAWAAAITRASLPGVPPEQALTPQERTSCRSNLRTKWASTVTRDVAAVDPGGQAIPLDVRELFERAVGDQKLAPGMPPCPWPI